MERLEGRTAVITGCNRGIGRQMMLDFMKAGANIVACTRKETDEIKAFYTQSEREYKINIYPLYFDLSDETEVRGAMKQLLTSKLKIDILVNNAGMPHMGYLQFTSLETIKQVFQINYFSVVLMTQLISKIMIRQKSGSIINIGSMTGLDNFAGYTAYGSSKAAIMHFTRTIARELAPFNIRVNSVAPGLLEDGMGQLQHDKSSDEILQRTDLKRRGTATDISNMVQYLASDKADFVTGQIFRVDGGM